MKGISLALWLVLAGLCSLFLGGRHIAWAAETRVAGPSSATLQYSPSRSSLTKVSVTISTNNAPVPTLVDGQWRCPPPSVPQAISSTTGGANGPGQPQYTEACVSSLNRFFFFPCSDVLNPLNGAMQPNEDIIRNDWLSGDVPVAGGLGQSYYSWGGRLVYTWTNETYKAPEVLQLFGYMQGLAFVLMTPSIMLLGYQIMLGASTFRYVGALDGLARVVLGGLAVAASYVLVTTLISFETVLMAGILVLHVEHPFPRITVNGVPVPYMLYNVFGHGEPVSSFRGIIVPMSRWGCAANNFMGIFSVPFVTNTLGSIIPLLSGFTHFAQTVTSMADLIDCIGQLILTVLSIALWIQAFVRILLINYYILTGPLAFGCWALPGGVGQRVVRLWCKGFFSVLFVQVLQVFLLTTLPLLLPTLPQIPADSVGLIQGFVLAFPPILTLYIALMAPRLLGTSAARAFGTAGSMAGGVFVAVGSAAYRMESN